jgi:hypothetical protein
MNKHPDCFPKPIRPVYDQIYRQLPDSCIWLSKNYITIIKYHGLQYHNIHVFKVDNGLIQNVKFYDQCTEVIFDDKSWEYGISTGKIKYLGKVNKTKLEKKLCNNKINFFLVIKDRKNDPKIDCLFK